MSEEGRGPLLCLSYKHVQAEVNVCFSALKNVQLLVSTLQYQQEDPSGHVRSLDLEINVHVFLRV